MSKNSLGELRLSPLKESGKFVFVNPDIRINNKVNKGDYIKIYVHSFVQEQGRYLLNADSKPLSRFVVRGILLEFEHTDNYLSIDDLYEKVCEMYRNQFYFGKIEI